MRENKRPYIFVTNDDGVNAKGIKTLVKLMCELGDVVVVAPDGARSGMSNALTVNEPIRYKTIEKTESLTIYSCTGTPTDCVKLAFDEILTRKPDLLVSGINHGSNAAVNVIYSGTMGATLEGCEKGVSSIGFSLCDHSADADFSCFEPYILKIAKEVLKKGLPDSVCLNVNAPVGELKGVKVARQCKGRWVNEFNKQQGADGETEYQLVGEFQNLEPNATDTDEWVLSQGYVSIVPTETDLTVYPMIKELNQWNW